jgi:hypothetical protein
MMTTNPTLWSAAVWGRSILHLLNGNRATGCSLSSKPNQTPPKTPPALHKRRVVPPNAKKMAEQTHGPSPLPVHHSPFAPAC